MEKDMCLCYIYICVHTYSFSYLSVLKRGFVKYSCRKLDTLESAVRLSAGVLQCRWAPQWVTVPWPHAHHDGYSFSVEPQHKLPGLMSINDVTVQTDCRRSEGKTKAVRITQTGNGGSHRFPAGCSVFTCLFSCLQVVVV